MIDRTIVIGHKNPDTDSICSAIAYSELKKMKGEKGIIAGRAGNINPQTRFVLQYFNQKAPTFFSDIYPRLSDVMVRDIVTADVDTPILNVMELFNQKKVRFIPVIDKEKKVAGTLAPINLTERFSTHVEPETARKVYTNPKNVALATDAKVQIKSKDNSLKEYSIFVGAMSEESFLKTIQKYEASSLIIIVGDREKILKGAIEKRVGIIIVTGNLKIDSKIIEAAKKNGVCLMVSPHDSASTAWFAKFSAPAKRFCTNNFLSRPSKERVESCKKTLLKSREGGIVVTDESGVLLGVVTNSCFLRTPGTRLVLMDHNELSQAVDGADQVEIIEVVDHHRIGGFSSVLPISFTIQPVGSTCTLVAEKYRDWGKEIPKNIAGLLFSGIISDTVTGRSPTTTSRDLEAMKWLEDVTGIKSEKFSAEMFGASSILGQKSAREVLLNDFKEFNVDGKKIGVGQVEVVGFERFEAVKKEIISELESLKNEKNYDLIGLMVTDITYEVTLFPMAADREICDSMELPEKDKNIFEMKNVLSRKKQVIPHLINVLKK